MSIKSFSVYKEYDDLIELLDSQEEKEQLVYAFWNYMFHNVIPSNLNNKQIAIFNNLKRPLDISKNKSNNKLNKIKIKSNENQNKIKIKSNENQMKNTSDVNVNNIYNINNISNRNNTDNYKEKEKYKKEKEDLSFEFNSIDYDDELKNKEQQITDFISKNDINITPAQYFEIVSKYLKHLEPVKINKALLLGNGKPFGYVRAILSSWLVNKFTKEQVQKKVIPDWLNKDIESSAVIEENDYDFKEFIKEFRKGEKKL